MAHETIPCAVTSKSVSLWLIWAQSSTKVNHILTSHQDKCEIAKASDSENVFYSSEMKTQRTTTPWKWSVWGDINETYRAVLQFRTLSSARSFHNSRLQRRCLKPKCFLWGENRPECASETSMTGVMKHITYFLCHCFSLLLHWRWTMETQNMLHCNIHQQRKKRSLYLESWYCCTILTQYIVQFCWIS